MSANDLGHLCRGRRIQMTGHSFLGICNIFGASSNFAWVYADAASAACLAHPDSRTMTSIIYDEDECCSVNSAQESASFFAMSPRSATLCLLKLGSNSELLR